MFSHSRSFVGCLILQDGPGQEVKLSLWPPFLESRCKTLCSFSSFLFLLFFSFSHFSHLASLHTVEGSWLISGLAPGNRKSFWSWFWLRFKRWFTRKTRLKDFRMEMASLHLGFSGQVQAEQIAQKKKGQESTFSLFGPSCAICYMHLLWPPLLCCGDTL